MTIPHYKEQKLRELFRNNTDCYAAKDWDENDQEVSVTPCMTEERFMEIIAKVGRILQQK